MTFALRITLPVAVLSLACYGPAYAESLDAKLGTWEMTTTTTATGAIIPADTLAKMPPDRRAMVEKMMAERDGKPVTTTRKTCVKKDDLDENHLMRQGDASCKLDVTTRTSQRLVATRTCEGNPRSEGRMVMEAKTPETIVGTIDQTRGESGKLHVDIAGKWLAAGCEGVDPIPAPPKKLP